MNRELIFRLLLAALLVSFTLIRVYYRWRTANIVSNASIKESGLNAALQSLFGLGLIIALVVYLVSPEQLAWARLALPVALRWLGVIIGIVGLILLLWSHHTLGKNFAATLHVRADHSLVTSGPYHWVRHPMYTSFYLLVFSFFLLSANWFLGLAWVSVISSVVLVRLPKEEALMIETFGDRYRAYMQHTGRLLPRLPGIRMLKL